MKIEKLILLSAVLIWGCSSQDAGTQQAAEAEEPEPIAVTQWTDETELFMEYPPLEVGSTSRFAIHLTDLDDFAPLVEGRVVVELAYGGAAADTFPVTGPSRPGIFGVDVTPTRAGNPAMTIWVDSRAATDEHRLGSVEVAAEHDEDEDHSHPHEEGAPVSAEEISFLKEQQWTMDFATEVVETGDVRDSLTVPAKIQPRSGGRVTVAAPVGGRLSSSVRLPVIGTTVQSGQIIAAIVPPTTSPSDLASLELAADEAQVALDFVRQELERLQRLVDAGAIPARRVHEAKMQESLALAQLKAAKARIDQYEQSRLAEHNEDGRTTFQVRTPLSGVVADVEVTDGAHVEDGEKLIEVVAVDLVYVVGEIPESEAAALRRPAGAAVLVPGIEDPIRPGRLISVANFVDPETRTVKVIYELSNPNRRLAVGQAVNLLLFGETTSEGATVAESAVVDDGGWPVVYIQSGGESFERRPVTLGARQDGRVVVTQGLGPGERVVTSGAYLIRLASMSTQAPAHGHVH